MSEGHRTALATSANGTNGTAQLPHPEFGDLPSRDLTTGGNFDAPKGRLSAAERVERELDEQRLQVERNRGYVELQRDTARLAVLSPKEIKAERQQAEDLRAAERQLAAMQALDEVEAKTSAFKANAKTRKREHREQVWQAKAKARRGRLLDPTSRLATIYRVQLATSAVLLTQVVIGVAWCAQTVGESLGGGSAYTIEPAFSVPLLVIMVLHAIAAQNRTEFPKNPKMKPVLLAIEIALFVVGTGLQVSAVIPKLDAPGANTAVLLITHLFPPALIVLGVTLQPVASTFLSELLTTVYVEAGEGSKRLEAEEVNLLQRARTINTLWHAGDLRSANANDPKDRTAGPSVAAVQEALQIRKEKAAAGVDAWAQLFGAAETQMVADLQSLLQRARTINALWETDKLASANANDPKDRQAGPSVKAVQDALKIRREKAEAGVDAWAVLYGPAETQLLARA